MPLLLQTLSFVRSVDLNCVRLTGHGIRGRKLLDYGCGYGRILRLMYYYSAPERTFGVDPWDRSIEICRADGLPSTLSISDYLPNSLPVGDTRFGLIYAFSVFTHLSERATRAALKTLRMYVEGDGVLVITVRPREYWEVVAAHGHVNSTRMLSDHDERGFAFAPHDRAPVDGDVTYGDTSLTLDWLSVNAAGWRVAATDRRPDDPQQVIVFLVPT
jgi:SAM-dependent methyltransferase